MYRAIDSQLCLVDKYAEQLEQEELFTKEQRQAHMNEYSDELKTELDTVDSGKTTPK
jgi:2-oxoglutarate dehydrogenase complex dehydrogenase (E1) component-like enzyme